MCPVYVNTLYHHCLIRIKKLCLFACNVFIQNMSLGKILIKYNKTVYGVFSCFITTTKLHDNIVFLITWSTSKKQQSWTWNVTSYFYHKSYHRITSHDTSKLIKKILKCELELNTGCPVKTNLTCQHKLWAWATTIGWS